MAALFNNIYIYIYEYKKDMKTTQYDVKKTYL